ncbi:general transcription factor IIE subunit 1 [Tachysurus fulvidraco]|uniref:general transcription factor IIE subunit 1 n=1 Tax=Tachysurus fulvidraco TaxID=1234273 RepID=UPI000F4FC55D|nr:general transcription factor IIE subunit 1 [Tachysurus fulvidraco]XP_026999456.1 general transcription factor IIE subunit 1 [Tachysurus fulvidraco]XP_026999457.1 general transcription factor IIE subunit 1 [Tachysurus fulvidraco]
MTEPEVLTEVPAALKRLAKQVVRGFYGLEHALALDVLIRNACVREEDMLELLKFDRKQLRSVLNTLKADKFVKCRMRVETAPDGKTTRHNYYFINYRLLVNVVKYKLDHMRRRIETDERDSTNRASFHCPNCCSTFTDLEANQLFDPMTGTFRCTFCQTEVEEDESAVPKKDARTLVARFNEQIEPIYVLLRETEDVNLSHELLEPEPTEIPALKQSRERAAAAAGLLAAGAAGREVWRTKGSSYEGLYTQNVVINMDEQESQQDRAAEAKAPKERPVWLTQSTVQGAYNENDALKAAGEDSMLTQESAAGRGHVQDKNEEVMRALLIHEKKSAPAPIGGAIHKTPIAANASDSESDTSESDEDSPVRAIAPPTKLGRPDEDDDEEGDEFEEVGDDPVVMVGGRTYSYREVSQRPELVEQMSTQEKEAYIEMGQNLFQDMYF